METAKLIVLIAFVVFALIIWRYGSEDSRRHRRWMKILKNLDAVIALSMEASGRYYYALISHVEIVGTTVKIHFKKAAKRGFVLGEKPTVTWTNLPEFTEFEFDWEAVDGSKDPESGRISFMNRGAGKITLHPKGEKMPENWDEPSSVA
jgi:hypothetical protein